MARYKIFKDGQTRIVVTTNLFEYGMSIANADIIFNYDMPENTDIYLRRVCLKKKFFFIN